MPTIQQNIADNIFEANRLLELDNIAEELDEEELNKIGKDAVDGYKRDEYSRQGWLERYEEWLRLAMQTVEVKNTPWKNSSNVKFPLLTQGAISFQARLYPALLSGPKVVKGRVIGKDSDGEKRASAIRIETHMSYQVLEQMEEWEPDMDKLTLILPIVGCMFKKSYYSSLKRRNVSAIIMPHDLCVNYGASDLDSAFRVTHILELTRNDLHERIMSGLFLDVELGTTNSQSEFNVRRKKMREEHNKTSEVGNEPEENLPREILEQHTYLDLDEDGYKEPYIITVDLQTSKVLRIAARYETNGIITNAKGEIVRINPTQYFTKYGFIPNPDGGFYDIGFGLLAGSLNDTVNTIINQLIDAGTLSNLQSGFIGRGLRVKGGRFRFNPGEWKIAHSTSGQKLKDNVVPLPVRDPSTVLFSLLGLLLESGQKLLSIVDSLTGENPGQNQKATTTLAIIEQGLKVFSAIQKRQYHSLKSEFKKLHRLNGIYLSEDEYYYILDDPEAEQQRAFKRDYQNDRTDVIPFADPNVSSEAQRLIKAQALIELKQLGFPLNPELVTKKVLEAQNQDDIEQLMKFEQGPSLEQLQYELEKAQFKHKVELDAEELELRKRELELKEMTDEAAALLTTMKASSEMHGQRLNEIQSLLSVITQTIQENDKDSGMEQSGSSSAS